MPMRPRTLLLAAALAAATPMARVHAQAADVAADAAARAVASWIVVDAPPGSEGRPNLNKVFAGWTVDAWGNYSKRVGSGRPRRVVDLEEGAAARGAGIVDENVDASEFLCGALDEAFDVGGLADVGDHAEDRGRNARTDRSDAELQADARAGEVLGRAFDRPGLQHRARRIEEEADQRDETDEENRAAGERDFLIHFLG